MNGLNQLTLSGTIVPTYDARGNLTSAGTTTYTYSSENMLTSATGGTSLAYDPFLRLQQISGAATTRFGYDGLDLIGEYDGSNALLRRYVHGPGMDQPIVWYEGTGTSDRRFLSADERGSVIAVSDSSGNLLATNSYDEYGIPGAGNIGRFQYTGQVWLPELGMYYYKARIYSPTLGRFLQTDPIGYADGMNTYAYVRNDPVNLFDPHGLSLQPLYGGIYTCFDGREVGDGDECHPDSPETQAYREAVVDLIVVTATKTKKLDGHSLLFYLQFEQMWAVTPTFHVYWVPLKLEGVYQCGNEKYERYVPAQPVVGAVAIIHTHQNKRSENPQGAWPGPEDGSNSVKNGQTTYGISSINSWAIRPGNPIVVERLTGNSWGGKFDANKYAVASTAGGGNANAGKGSGCKKIK